MISFKREESRVKIEIKSGVLGYEFFFTHECGKDYFAKLMTDAYQNKMEHELERIRCESYNEGWKDAKAKKQKRTWFAGWW